MKVVKLLVILTAIGAVHAMAAISGTPPVVVSHITMEAGGAANTFSVPRQFQIPPSMQAAHLLPVPAPTLPAMMTTVPPAPTKCFLNDGSPCRSPQ